MSSDEDEDPRFGEVIAAVKRSLEGKAGRTVTIADLSKHRKETDLWIKIGTSVLDITPLVTNKKRHPGGIKILQNLINKMDEDHDVTESFKKFHYPSGNAVKWIRDMYVGEFKDSGRRGPSGGGPVGKSCTVL